MVFSIGLQRCSRIFQLALIPLSVLLIAIIAYHFKAPLIQQWLLQANWLPYACVIIASIIAWQFGRSRLVWLSLLLLVIVNPLDPSWLDFGISHTVQLCFMLLVLSWLMLSSDKGFSPKNFITAIFIIALVAALSIWLMPLLASNNLSHRYVLTPTTSWLFQLWPDLRQWFNATELLFVLLTLVLGLGSSLKHPNNSQITLFISSLSLIILHTINLSPANQLAVLTLAILVCIAVIKDSFAMAFKDELTGIPSRRALMQYVQTLGRKYVVVMSDIDHFKKFNDTYGHDVGDEVLKLVASKLNKVTGGGKVFRFGGEEFVIVFASKTTADVVPHVETIRQLIADYDIALRAKPRPAQVPQKAANKPAKDKVVKVTTSFGVAHKTSQHSDFAAIMKQADIALYAAKKAGRNCVKVAKQ